MALNTGICRRSERKGRQMWRTMNARDVSLNVVGNQKPLKVYEQWGDITKPMKGTLSQQQCREGTGKETDLNHNLIKSCVFKLDIGLTSFIRSNKQPCRQSRIARGHKAGGRNHQATKCVHCLTFSKSSTHSVFLDLLSNGINNVYPFSQTC